MICWKQSFEVDLIVVSEAMLRTVKQQVVVLNRFM
jgi:hypothetical protein